ncbi:MAG: alkaline phosphatase, partial [Planctomycetota bacterium]
FEIEMGIAPLDDDAKRLFATRSGYAAGVKSTDLLVPLCGRLLDARAGVHWSTGDHSAADVPVFAIGAGAEQFAGRYDNTQIARRLFSLLDSPVQSTPVQENEPEPAAVAK